VLGLTRWVLGVYEIFKCDEAEYGSHTRTVGGSVSVCRSLETLVHGKSLQETGRKDRKDHDLLFHRNPEGYEMIVTLISMRGIARGIWILT
jgi:hypothetical protein